MQAYYHSLMFNVKSVFVLLLSILWCYASWYWYTCHIKGFCVFERVTSEVVEQASYNPPITFNKSSFVCIKGPSFNAYADSLHNLLETNGTLSIVGLYDSTEINKSLHQNLGLARAFRIKCMLAKLIDTSKITIQSKKITDLSKTESFVAHLTKIVIGEASDAVEALPNKETFVSRAVEPQKESPTKIALPSNSIQNKGAAKYVFYFAKGAIKRAFSDEEYLYLNKLADELYDSEKKIKIVGYYDAGEDIKLARIRAWVVKSQLLERGVNSHQLITQGQDNSTSAAKSGTAEGNKLNRKVEIRY